MWHHRKKRRGSLATALKGREYCDLTDKEFRVAAMKKLRQFSRVRNKICEQNDFLKRLRFKREPNKF